MYFHLCILTVLYHHNSLLSSEMHENYHVLLLSKQSGVNLTCLTTAEFSKEEQIKQKYDTIKCRICLSYVPKQRYVGGKY